MVDRLSNLELKFKQGTEFAVLIAVVMSGIYSYLYIYKNTLDSFQLREKKALAKLFLLESIPEARECYRR